MMKTMKKIATATQKAGAEARPVQAKKQSAPPMRLSQNPKAVIKKQVKKPCKPVSTKPLEVTKKKQPIPEVCGNPKAFPAVKKNDKDTLELFEKAKKSADVANTKGLLAAKAETSICVDTLSLLITMPISATAPETRRITERLGHLTRHKDRKICNSASALLQHWSQSIRDQQH
ncbi:transcription elongation factor TFIIS [Brassica rapa]|nr:transcription elongation factor TFIIS [Brassica rapa]XP_013739005.2 transcription elongation factor TFIIS-like [Brassica napus]